MVNGYALMGKAHATALQAKNKVKNDWNDFKAGELSAQGLIEYVLIIAVISIIVITVGPQVTNAISKQFKKIADALTAGNNLTTPDITPGVGA